MNAAVLEYINDTHTRGLTVPRRVSVSSAPVPSADLEAVEHLFEIIQLEQVSLAISLDDQYRNGSIRLRHLRFSDPVAVKLASARDFANASSLGSGNTSQTEFAQAEQFAHTHPLEFEKIATELQLGNKNLISTAKVLKATSLTLIAICLISLGIWMGTGVILVSPFASMVILVMAPFYYFMALVAKKP